MLNFKEIFFGQWFDTDSNLHEYGSELERYILANNPQSVYDVEQLTRQFEQKSTKGQ